MSINPKICEKASDFLQCTTPTYLGSLFKTLRLSFIPILVQKLQINPHDS